MTEPKFKKGDKVFAFDTASIFLFTGIQTGVITKVFKDGISYEISCNKRTLFVENEVYATLEEAHTALLERFKSKVRCLELEQLVLKDKEAPIC